ncbi:hypothetical protein F4677DRAFT_429026 [Hypoxylon crocopeplum]|nr:hypothetical protein F4677DRAFT_429026 [Hypoxylon crocopeplum]
MHRELLAQVVALVSLSGAHVILENPKPFRFIDYGPSNPISPTGTDFPCKLPPGANLEPQGEPTVMAIGDEQMVSFTGQAVHGGGSCQFALSGPVSDGSWADYPIRDAEWKVIHSIEGGCPARNQKGNLEGPNQDEYSFQIPEGIEPGSYVFSWTWFPRIGGQPEMYQNCAPIIVTSAKTKRMNRSDRRALLTRSTDFPELFLADVGEISGGCTTEEPLQQQVAIAFPNPGLSVEHPEGTANLFKQACDGNPRTNQDQFQGGDAAGTSDVSTSSQASAPSVQDDGLATEPSTSLIVSTSSAIASSPDDSVSTPTPDPATIPTSSTEACTEGHLTCLNDGTHFATCSGGQLTPPQPIAPGFKCQVGSGVGLDISPA